MTQTFFLLPFFSLLPPPQMETSQLLVACHWGIVEDVKTILKENPEININKWGETGMAALHIACREGRDNVVAILLAHPGIGVNMINMTGSTPFSLAVRNGQVECVRLLLEDPRVTSHNQKNNDGESPLWLAANRGFIDVIKVWMASGKPMDMGTPGDEWSDPVKGAEKRPMFMSRESEMIRNKDASGDLLKRFREDPDRTRYKVRLELGICKELAADFFALVVFVCDGLLKYPEDGRRFYTVSDTITTDTAVTTTTRLINITGMTGFLGIARRLPIEIQMVLCCRVVGWGADNIPGGAREAAFRGLAAALPR